MLSATFIGCRLQEDVHNSKKSQLYTFLGSERHLVLHSLVTEFGDVCTQFKEFTLPIWGGWAGSNIQGEFLFGDSLICRCQ